jgi:putative phosphoribosyl transferase
MYFHDRSQAGELLASQLLQYRFENTAVLSLSQGGVMVGEQIARRLHCTLSLLLTARITAPGESSLTLGTIDQEGTFTYNDLIPAGEMEEYMEDFRGYLEEEKIRQLYAMTSVVAEGGMASPDLLAGRNIILATDGVKNGLSFDAAMHYLKPIHTEKVIAAIPVGPADVIERVGQKVDELYYLYVPDNFIRVRHYYEDNTMFDPDAVIDSINHIISRWI